MEKLSRKQFIQTAVLGLGYLIIPKEINENLNTEETHAYLAQKSNYDCGHAILAMILADNLNLNVETTYSDIQEYYSSIGKQGVYLGAIAIKNYLIKEHLKPIQNYRKENWQEYELRRHLYLNGSTIVDVTSNYGAVNQDSSNYPNHWIILDEIKDEGESALSVVRDPLHSDTKHFPPEDLKPFMIPMGDGSICIPNEILIPAIGNNTIYLSDNINRTIRQKNY